MAGSYLVGVDVGGTTVTTQVADADLRPLHELTVATDTSSPDATLHSIAAGIAAALEGAGVSGAPAAIGLGVPGQVDAANGVSRIAVNLHWYDYPVAARLRERFGAPVLLQNDVRVAALGVYRFDNPRGRQDLVYVSIGTGVAAGVILGGQPLLGRNGLAGELGHFIVEPDGPPCNCGARGCLETLVSATAVIRLGRAAGLRAQSGAQTSSPALAAAEQAGTPALQLTAKDVYDAAAAGDPAAQQIVEGVGERLGVALRNVLLAYDVEEIVLGGGVTRAGERYLQPILAQWAQQRATSALARAMLTPDKLRIADPTRNMGAWGAVALAARGVEP